MMPETIRRFCKRTISCQSSNTELKYLTLGYLVVVNIILVFSISVSRTPDVQIDNFGRIKRKQLYLTSTAVVVSEFLKLLASMVLEFYMNYGPEYSSNLQAFMNDVFNELTHTDTLKIGVPGILYVIENNLLFIALGNLSVSVYEVTDQMKILTTAVFSVLMLNMSLSRLQKLSLFMLAAGVGVVELSHSEEENAPGSRNKNQGVGLCAILMACCISGFAGVSFEKIVKHGRPVSIYIRNVQLALFGVTFGILMVYFTDENAVHHLGFFQGYTGITWCVVIAQAVCGVINALVIKYADNILKGFAASVATIVAAAISSVILEVPITSMFLLGCSMVVGSVFLYGNFPAKQGEEEKPPGRKKPSKLKIEIK